MGDPNVLQSFLTWAMTTYQADHYAVVVFDSGEGYMGVAADETDADFLTMSELSSALSGALTAASVDQFDVLDFDSGYMDMMEVGYQVRNIGQHHGRLRGHGARRGRIPYDIVLGDLVDNPEWKDVELAQAIAESYQVYPGFKGSHAVIDLTQMGPLGAALSNFSTTFVNDATGTDRNQLSQHLADSAAVLQRRLPGPGRADDGPLR